MKPRTYDLIQKYPGILGFSLSIMIIFGICGVASADPDNNQTLTINGTNCEYEPDYETLFSDDIVHEIHIIIDPQDWQTMQDDLAANFSRMSGFPGDDQSPPLPLEPRTPGDLENMGNMSHMDRMGGMPGFGDTDPVYVQATISTHGTVLEHVGIRYKGCNSLQGAIQENSGKISLKLDMDHYEDEYQKTDDQTLFGFGELNLQSNYADTSLIREKIVPELFTSAGVIAPDTAFYRVYVDYGDGPVYFGLYTMIEAVEDTLITTGFVDGSGNLYKPEGSGATFEEGTLNVSSFEKKTNKKENDYSDIKTLYSVLHSSTRLENPVSWRADLESVLNVDEFLRWLATNTVIQNWDTYGGNSRNYYLYSDPDTGTFFWIPWDNNYALMDSMPKKAGFDDFNRPDFAGNETEVNRTGMFPGFFMGNISNPAPAGGNMMDGLNTEQGRGPPMPMGHNGGGGMGKTLSISLDEVGDNWPLIRYLMDDPVYQAEYHSYLKEVVTGAFNPESVIAQYQAYHDLIQPYVVGDEGEQPGYSYLTSAEDFDTALSALIAHVQSRHTAVMDYLETVEASD